MSACAKLGCQARKIRVKNRMVRACSPQAPLKNQTPKDAPPDSKDWPTRWVSRLGAFCPGAGSSRPLALVQSLANQCLDDRLPADIQISGGAFEFFRHGGRKIHVRALDGFSHRDGVGEKARNILAIVGYPSDGFGRGRLLLKWCVLHRVSAPRWLLSIRSPDGRTLLPHLPESQKPLSTVGHAPNRWRDVEWEGPNVGRSNRDDRKSPVLPRSQFRASDSAEGSCSFAHRNGIAQGITVIPWPREEWNRKAEKMEERESQSCADHACGACQKPSPKTAPFLQPNS